MYYTSYFGNIKNIDKNYTLAAITASKPTFCGDSILDWSFLGPSFSLLNRYKNNEIAEEEYKKEYLENLDQSWNGIKDFILVNYPKNIVLLCYEKPPKFCHRHLLAEFLKEKGIDCEELPYVV